MTIDNREIYGILLDDGKCVLVIHKKGIPMEKLIQYASKVALSKDTPAWTSVGMGYILCTEHGQLCVIDGGNAEDAELLIELLEKNAEGKPVVSMWILTHPHSDHYGALLGICEREDLAARVEVRKIVCDFPVAFKDKRLAVALECMKTIYAVTGAEEYKPVIDEKIYVDGMEFHILNTPVDCTLFSDSNQLSLIFTVQSTHKKIMITGDANDRNLQMVVWRYPSGLKCDILQIPHHGLCDGNREFYEKVNADTLIIPTSRANEREMRENAYYAMLSESNTWAAENASVVYKAYEGTVEIAL